MRNGAHAKTAKAAKGRCRCVVVSGRIFKREDRKGANSDSDNRARECPCRANDSCGAWSVGVAHGYDGSGLRPVYVTEGCFGTEESLVTRQAVSPDLMRWDLHDSDGVHSEPR